MKKLENVVDGSFPLFPLEARDAMAAKSVGDFASIKKFLSLVYGQRTAAEPPRYHAKLTFRLFGYKTRKKGKKVRYTEPLLELQLQSPTMEELDGVYSEFKRNEAATMQLADIVERQSSRDLTKFLQSNGFQSPQLVSRGELDVEKILAQFNTLAIRYKHDVTESMKALYEAAISNEDLHEKKRQFANSHGFVRGKLHEKYDLEGIRRFFEEKKRSTPSLAESFEIMNAAFNEPKSMDTMVRSYARKMVSRGVVLYRDQMDYSDLIELVRKSSIAKRLNTMLNIIASGGLGYEISVEEKPFNFQGEEVDISTLARRDEIARLVGRSINQLADELNLNYNSGHGTFIGGIRSQVNYNGDTVTASPVRVGPTQKLDVYRDFDRFWTAFSGVMALRGAMEERNLQNINEIAQEFGSNGAYKKNDPGNGGNHSADKPRWTSYDEFLVAMEAAENDSHHLRSTPFFAMYKAAQAGRVSLRLE